MAQYQLVVKTAFADFSVGDHIADPELVERFGATHPEYVVRKLLPETSASASTFPQSQTVPTLKAIG